MWISNYADSKSGMVLDTYTPNYIRLPSHGRGLGNELDWVWDGARWAPVGQGGAQQVDIPGFGLFRWRFEANSGDRYTGYIYADSALYDAGSAMTAPPAATVIESVVRHQPERRASGADRLDRLLLPIPMRTAR